MDGLEPPKFDKNEGIHDSLAGGDEMSYLPEHNFQGLENLPGVHTSVITYPSVSSAIVTGQPSPSQPLNRETDSMRTNVLPTSTNEAPSLLSVSSNSGGNVKNFVVPARLSLIQGTNGKQHVGYVISGTNDVMTPKMNIIPSRSSPVNPGVTSLTALPSLPNAPPGLIPLTLVNKVLIDRKDDKCKAKGFTLHKYMILNESGYQLFTAIEEHFVWKRFGSGCHEKLVVHFLDEAGTEIIKATKELTFSDCEILVEAAVGEVCGYLRKTDLGHVVLNSNKDTMLTIRNTVAPFCLCLNDVSKVIGMDGSVVGKVDLENFSGQLSVTFPKDLDFKAKAILLSFAVLSNSH